MILWWALFGIVFKTLTADLDSSWYVEIHLYLDQCMRVGWHVTQMSAGTMLFCLILRPRKDGFPRTLKQAKALDAMLAQEGAVVTKVVELQVPDSVLEERICGRWIHKESGRSYHVKYAPPKSMKKDAKGKPIESTMLDDETGEPLMQRKDDTAEALIKRLQGYHSETVPILEHYRPHGIVRTVNANQNMNGVWSEILEALQRGGSDK